MRRILILFLLINTTIIFAEKNFYMRAFYNFEEPNIYYTTVYDYNKTCGEDYWGLSSIGANGTAHSFWCAQVGTQCNNENINNKDIKKYDLYMNSYLIIGPPDGFDFSHISDGYVQFELLARYEDDPSDDVDSFYYGIIYGKNPRESQTYGTFLEHRNDNWESITLDLKNVDGHNYSVIGDEHRVWLCFIFTSGGAPDTVDEGVYIDEIKVMVYPRIFCELYLNKPLFKSGDLFRLRINFFNPTINNSDIFDYYVILDVYGQYFFGYKPEGSTYFQWVEGELVGTTSYMNMSGGSWGINVLDFIFPQIEYPAYDLYFYGAVTDHENVQELYNYDIVKFGFEPAATFTPTPTQTPIVYTPTPVPSGVPTFTPTPWIKTFRIYGNQEYIDTGIDLNYGERIIINADGTICFHNGDCEGTSVGPDGYSEFCYESECYNQPFDPGRHHGALIGKIGNGEFFLIGSHLEMNSNVSDRLRLFINDGNVADNGGFFDVEITLPDR